MNLNSVKLNNINNCVFNFKKLLTLKDSLIWNNCKNNKIKIKSKINKIVLINCSNITLKIGSTISGIEIENCKNIKIKIIENTDPKVLVCLKSNIKIYLQKNQKKKTQFLLEACNIEFIVS